jgi:hypothetical protein
VDLRCPAQTRAVLRLGRGRPCGALRVGVGRHLHRGYRLPRCYRHGL